MKTVQYGEWTAHPEIIDQLMAMPQPDSIWQRMDTFHEGSVLYSKQWNFWVRAGIEADTRSDVFFRDYEKANADSDKLLKAVGFSWSKAETEAEVWARIGLVWQWLSANVQDNTAEYANISSVPNEWPSILDYAHYYATHGHLVWAACFSKAHLFATLLGRMVYPRYRFGIAETHHAEDDAPPTATHVYVGAYVFDRWYYLDPTAVYGTPFPNSAHAKSIGVASFTTVDYQHPYSFIPLPLSGFEDVPYLPA